MQETKTQPGYAPAPTGIGVPARIVRLRKNSDKLELSLTPPIHWMPKLQSGARDFDAIIHLPTGANLVARLRLHRVTPKGTTYLFYVKRPASELLAPLLATGHRVVVLIDLWPRPEVRKKIEKTSATPT